VKWHGLPVPIGTPVPLFSLGHWLMHTRATSGADADFNACVAC